ncbi:MAG: DUF5654 family protein [Candidatus Aenigmatarchaeota archaeon]
MAEIEKEIEKLNIRGIILSAIITAFSFVIGLAWRDAIMATIEQIKPTGSGLFYTYVYAIMVTIFVVLMAFILIKLNQKIEETKLKIKKSKSKMGR